MDTLFRLRRYGTRLFMLILGFALALFPSFARASEDAISAQKTTEVFESEQPEGSTAPGTGYITILLTGEANGSGATMTSGQISLYCVAITNRDDPSNYIYDTSLGQFASSSAVADISSMTKEELDAQNPKISEKLEQEVTTKGIKPLQTVDIADGEVTYPEVKEGLYLLVQTEPSDADRTIRSFIISVPDDEGNLGVVAKPKPGAWDEIDPNEKKQDQKKDEKQQDGKKQEQKKNGQQNGKSTTTSATTTPASVGLRVPATGDRLPLVVPVVAGGLVLVVVGVILHRHAGNRS